MRTFASGTTKSAQVLQLELNFMMKIASLINHLRLFDYNLEHPEESLPSPKDRKNYAEAIAKCFIPCARKILAGYFKVTNDVGGPELFRTIHPIAIELYYHEEDPDGFKDPIMYHTDYRKRSDLKAKGETYFSLTGLKELPYYPIGSLNPHTSGIDVTFENAEKHYRASFLIRKYEVFYEKGGHRVVNNSTEIYDDLLLNGITLDNADWIEWFDGDEEIKDVKRGWRQNVPAYKKESESSVLWVKERSTEGDTFSINKVSYVRCPFRWQFAKE